VAAVSRIRRSGDFALLAGAHGGWPCLG
jgi:hypothetical protein